MSPIKIDAMDLMGGKKLSGSLVAFPTACFLAITSIVAAVVALVVYGSQALTVDLWVCQALVICASSGSFVFLGLYLLAARRNEPLGSERPPSRPLHAGSFIALRVTVILWIAGSISTLVVAIKMPSCPASSIACQLQQASAAMSSSAFFASLALIFILDKCDKPFETPGFLHIRPKALPVCDDDLLERSVSRASTYHSEKAAVLERISEEGSSVSEHSAPSSITRKPLPPDSPVLLHGFVQSEPAPFLPMPQKLSVFSLQALSQGFKVDKRLSSATNLFEETGCTKECCTPALSERVPSEYTVSSKQSSASSSGNDSRSLTSSKSGSVSSSGNDSRSLTSSKSGPTTWNSSSTTLTRSKSGWSTPSSSSSSTRRSPLSTVRNADQPDIAIHPEFQNFQNFQASQIAALPPPQQWADPRYYQTGAILPHRPMSRGSSSTSLMISPVSMRKQSLQQNALRQHGVPRPQTPRNPAAAPRRRPGDMQVAGTHVGYEDAIDAHTRKIEESIASRVKDIERREKRLREQAEASMRMVAPSPRPISPRTSPRSSPGLSPKMSPRMPPRSSPRPSSPRVTKSHGTRTPDLRYGDHRMRTPPRQPVYQFFPPQARSPRPRQQHQHQRPRSPQHPRTSPQPQRSPRQWPLSNEIVIEPLRIVKRKPSGDSQLPLTPLPQQSPYPILGGGAGAGKPSPPPQSLFDEPRPGSVTPRTAAAEPSHQYNWPIPNPARARVRAQEPDFDGQRDIAREISRATMEESVGGRSEKIAEESPVLPDLVLDGGKLWDGEFI